MKCSVLQRVDHFFQRHIPRYRLWRICKAIGIKPHPWQRDFALGKSEYLYGRSERATGKTMAVMLRVLMLPVDLAEPYMFADDPDWLERDAIRVWWYIREYRRLAFRCAEMGVPVPAVPLQYQTRR